MLSKLKLARSILLLIILGSFLSILWLPTSIEYSRSWAFVKGEAAQADFLMNFTTWQRQGDAWVATQELLVGRDGGAAHGQLGLLAIYGFEENVLFSAEQAPAGVTVTFSPASWTPTTSAFGFIDVFVVGSQQLVEGSVMSFVIRGKSSSVEHTLTVTFRVVQETPTVTLRQHTYIEISAPQRVTPLSAFNVEGKLMLGGYQTPLGGKELLITTGWNDKKVEVKTDANGWFSYTFTAPEAGVYSIKVEFMGDDEYAPSEKTIGVIVAPPSTSQPPPTCLIATATYGSELSPEVQFLREFRDQVMQTLAGREFMAVFNAWYYSFSPSIATVIAGNPLIQAVFKILLYPLMGILHLSAATYSVFSFNPELAVLVAGLVTSSLIGAIYFSSLTILALLVQGKSKKTLTMRHWKSLAIIWTASLMLILVGEALLIQMAMMVGTSMFVLTNLSLSAMAVGTRIFYIIKR